MHTMRSWMTDRRSTRPARGVVHPDWMMRPLRPATTIDIMGREVGRRGASHPGEDGDR
jgi:hypothetical protein